MQEESAPRRRLRRLVAATGAAGRGGLAPSPAAPPGDLRRVRLPSGDAMPSVGLGLWKVSRASSADVCYEAVRAGYRCFDCACDYGNERECGEGIRRAIQEGLVRREDLWITSKLWNTYHRRAHAIAACRRSLQDLGLEYVDLYMIHFPISLKFVPFEKRYPPEWVHDPEAPNPRMEEDPVPLRETWEAMEELHSQGLARNIGVCNMGTAMLRDILSYARVKPGMLQVELHPYNTQQRLVRFCREAGIAVTGFSNLGASSYVEMGAATRADSCLEEPAVKAIAEAHGRTPAQVVLRWAVQRGTAVVPKSANPERMRQNLDVFGFALTPGDMAAIDALNRDRRFNDPGAFCEEAFGTFFPIYD